MLILVNGLVMGTSLHVFAQTAGVIIVIGSDTTWTKADSPHRLTGPLLVNQGVTLTVEAGASVNLNGYEMRINGTLRAIGTSTEKIHFKNGTINFTEFSVAWNEETGSGSILQYSLLDDVKIVNSVPVSINNNPIGDDNVWTKEESPIDFSGPVIVDSGKTLTIEAGVTVNLKSYDLVVDGTLRVLGSSSDKVYFKVGRLVFTESSNGWDEQAGSGSMIDNAVLDRADIVSNVSLKITNSNITYKVWVDSSSILAGNIINTLVITGGSVIVSDNEINTINGCYGTPEISHNTIDSISGSGGSPVISDNTITKIGYVEHTRQNKKVIHYLTADSPSITNNVVNDGIYLNATGQSTISHNTITGHLYAYTSYYSMGMFYTGTKTETATTSGIILEGTGHIIENTITECKVGIKTGIQEGTVIEGNVLDNNDKGLEVYSEAVIQKNTFSSNEVAIFTYNDGLFTIKDNLFINNEKGILTEGNVNIERNSMTNNQIAILLHSQLQAVIKNNTFTDNTEAIRIENNPSVTINYNNFENCIQSNINLVNTSNTIDATNNWWGTADTQATNLTIHDYKYEFGLGRVDFTPFLTEPNTEAEPTPSTEIPEFPQWLLLPLFLVATFVVVFYRKRLTANKN